MSKTIKPTTKKQRAGTTTPQTTGVNHKLSKQFQKILDALPAAMILVDREGHIQTMNGRAKTLIGNADQSLKPEEWPEKFGFYLDDGLVLYPGKKFPLTRALQGETIDESEEMILRNEGKVGIWISMSTDLLKDKNGDIEGAVALIRDITYRKRIELSREKHIQRTEILYKLSRAIAEEGTNLDKTAQVVVKFTAEAIGDVCVITLLNPSGDMSKIAAFHNTSLRGQALLRKSLSLDVEYDHLQTLGGGVIKSGEPLLIPSLAPEQIHLVQLPGMQEFMKAESGIESVLIAPLTGRTGTIGTITLFRHSGGKAYSVDDQSFLIDIAYRAALAVENCRLFDSLREEIKERLSAKRELEMSVESARSIFDSVLHGIKVLDLDGKILETNPAFQKMIGYSEDEIKGRPFTDFLESHDAVRGLKLFQNAKNTGDPNHIRFEHRAIHKDGSIVWAKTFFTVIKNSNEDRNLAFIVGIVENITEQKRLELEMAELSNRLRSGMELERLRLAQELHDNPMQSLYSASYQIEELRRHADPSLKKALKQVNNTIQNVVHELRATAKELRPPTIFSFGLENAIRSHVNDVIEKHPNIKIHLSLTHDRQILPENVRLALFRVLQQSLANVVRHAEATEVKVHFSFDAEEAHLEISDNGKGFDVPSNWMEFVRQEHYGLAGATERMTALGGVLRVESVPGHSTTIRATVPWTESRS